MEKLLFHKYHGNGNDFIIVDSRKTLFFNDITKDEVQVFQKLCNRNFGIGADGIILIMKPEYNNYAKMRIFNSDGSEAQMCGNGIRCLVDYLYSSELEDNNTIEIKIETNAGLKIAEYNKGKITVLMGKPIFDTNLIPTTINNKKNDLAFYEFSKENFKNLGYAVGMGNPHLIFFVNDLENINVSLVGQFFENHPLFPQKTNVHFCKLIQDNVIKVKVWERGAGQTLACGTGACAVHVVAYKLGLCDKNTIISLPGGDLSIEWFDNNDEVKMTGLAQKVFSGEIYI